jgi:hypothetical protein
MMSRCACMIYWLDLMTYEYYLGTRIRWRTI